jgi:hypothetical protein
MRLYKTNVNTASSTEECVICLGPLSNDVIELECGHIFHYNCIVTNMLYNQSYEKIRCPLCRKETLYNSFTNHIFLNENSGSVNNELIINISRLNNYSNNNDTENVTYRKIVKLLIIFASLMLFLFLWVLFIVNIKNNNNKI